MYVRQLTYANTTYVLKPVPSPWSTLAIVVFTFSPVASRISEHRVMKKTSNLEKENRVYNTQHKTSIHIDLVHKILRFFVKIKFRHNTLI